MNETKNGTEFRKRSKMLLILGFVGCFLPVSPALPPRFIPHYGRSVPRRLTAAADNLGL